MRAVTGLGKAVTAVANPTLEDLYDDISST